MHPESLSQCYRRTLETRRWRCLDFDNGQLPLLDVPTLLSDLNHHEEMKDSQASSKSMDNSTQKSISQITHDSECDMIKQPTVTTIHGMKPLIRDPHKLITVRRKIETISYPNPSSMQSSPFLSNESEYRPIMAKRPRRINSDTTSIDDDEKYYTNNDHHNTTKSNHSSVSISSSSINSSSFESGMNFLRRENPGMAKSIAKQNQSNDQNNNNNNTSSSSSFTNASCFNGTITTSKLWKSDGVLCDELTDCDPEMVKQISQNLIDSSEGIDWSDISGLEKQKQAIQEIVIWPMKAPQLFTGLLEPPKGVLLFGPPGTGKTMIAKACASESQWNFLSVSASSLTSKWFGTAEKMVKALFAVANLLSPSVVFIDEIDSLLCQRTAGESDAMRRIKTELLVALDGTKQTKQVLVIGATNRPQELDDAARRRLVRRLYIPLPDISGRFHLLRKLLSQANHELSDLQIEEIARVTEGYSGADITQLAKRAAMKPLRDLCKSAGGLNTLEHLDHTSVRPLCKNDLDSALLEIRPSVASTEIEQYIQWNKEFGCTD